MPTFGEFETVGEPLATTRELGHISYVWQAHRVGGGEDRTYAIKCYAPKRRAAAGGGTVEALGRDRGLEFLEGIKQMEKIRAEGGPGARCLSRIYGCGKTVDDPDWGLTHEGAWYATDFCQGKTLKELITIRGRVDGDALRHVVGSVLSGCLALQSARGCGHGNLKPSNVLLPGPARKLSSRTLLLADPFPAAPSQLEGLASHDRQEVSELMKDVVQARDLRAIGELILQLVEGRVIASGYDFDYPVQSSPGWVRLGKESQYWLDLCNRLLDPQLTLDKVNFESLRTEFKPARDMGPVVKMVAIAVGVVVVLVALGGGGHLLWKANSDRRAKANQAAETQWNQVLAEGEQYLAQTNFSGATERFEAAGKAARILKDAAKEAEARRLLALARSFQAAREEWDKSEPDYLAVLQRFIDAKPNVGADASAPHVQWQRMVESNACQKATEKCAELVLQAYAGLDTTTNPLATAQALFRQANDYSAKLKKVLPGGNLEPTNGLAGSPLVSDLLGAKEALGTNLALAETLAKEVLSARRENQRAREIVNLVAVARGETAKKLVGFGDAVRTLWAEKDPENLIKVATNSFAQNPSLQAADFAPPPIWSSMGTNREIESSELKAQLSRNSSKETFLEWWNRVRADYAPLPAEAVSALPKTAIVETDIADFKKADSGVDPQKVSDLQGELGSLKTRMTTFRTNAARGGIHNRFFEQETNEIKRLYSVITNKIELARRDSKKNAEDRDYADADSALKAAVRDGDFSKVELACKRYPKVDRFARLLGTVDDQKRKLTETLRSLTNALQGDSCKRVFANLLFTNHPDVMWIQRQAIRQTNLLGEAAGLREDCHFEKARTTITTAGLTSSAATNFLKQLQDEEVAYDKIDGLVKSGDCRGAVTYFEGDLPKELRAGTCITNRYTEAQRALASNAAYSAATNSAYGAGDYSNVVQTCSQYPNDRRFRDLRSEMTNRIVALAKLQLMLDNGEYSNLLNSVDGYSEPPFKTLRAQGTDEQRILDGLVRLKTPAQYQKLVDRVDELASRAGLWKKRPFMDVKQWLVENEPRKKAEIDLNKLNDEVNGLPPTAYTEPYRRRWKTLQKAFERDQSHKGTFDHIEKILNLIDNPP